jgi:serine/threonine-protein kinase
VHLSEGLKVADKFRLVRELGKGGMGAVWLAEHTGLDMLCAIKLVDPGRETADLRARFEREAKAAAQIRSRHVVQILDYGVWQEMPYIAMEYLHGEDLSNRLTRLGRLPPAEVHRIASQVGRALTRAHAAGIVHRDLKPENVFLAREEDGEICKVLDFGIAKRPTLEITDTNTKEGSLVGTPFYMSPEQARGSRQIDHRSDLWALAVIVFEALTGHLPFDAEGLGDVLGKIIYEALPVPSGLALGVPPGFDSWWTRAAAREPDQRFQNAQDFCDSLALALGVTSTFVPLISSSPSHPDLGLHGGPNPLREDVPTMIAMPGEGIPARGTTADALSHTVAPRGMRSSRWLLACAVVVVLGGVGVVAWTRTSANEQAQAPPAGVSPEPAPAAQPAAPPATPVEQPAAANPEKAEPKAAEPSASTGTEPDVASSQRAARRPKSRTPPQKSDTKRSTAKPAKTVDFGI